MTATIQRVQRSTTVKLFDGISPAETPLAIVDLDAEDKIVGLQIFAAGRLVNIAPVAVERVAELLAALRSDTNDFRVVCAQHGYHEEGPCALCEATAP